MLAAEHSDVLSQLLTGVVGLVVAATASINHREGKTRGSGRRTDLSEIKEAIKENHTEMRGEVRELRETLSMRMDVIEAKAEDAQQDATKALHAAVGVDG